MRLATPHLAILAFVLTASTAAAQSSTADAPQQPASSSSAATEPANPSAAQSATDQNGKPIADTLTYTIDPATGQPIQPLPPPTKAERKAALAARHSSFDDRYHFGVLATIGTAGAGFQIGVPLIPHLALRMGGDYIRYTGSYKYDAANIAANLQFGYGRVAVDYFPWRDRRFHISPLLIVANQTHLQANVSFDQNSTFDFSGQSFYSSPADPLGGVGRVDLRKTSPGLTVGFGNLTHGRGHWTFPVEMGFFYNDQPKLQVNFSGTVCATGQPLISCRKVQDQADFQTRYKAFIARQNNNLSYAKFIPVFNFGVGFRF